MGNFQAKDKVLEIEHSSQRRRVGILGGTFDPIHYGHLVIAEEVRVALDLTEVLFIPASQPPHKLSHHITPVYHRVAMLELALVSNPHFFYSCIEIERNGPSYTADTLQTLRERWGSETDIDFIIGWDSLEELHTWHDAPRLLSALTHLVAVRRPGYEDDAEYNNTLETRLPGILQRLLIVPAPQLDISATELRERVASGKPIKYQTPEPVEAYIKKNKLYL
ncbi:MAG TPA: nicotinic acid mononucleotide adenylyltransferase [Ktedonobacter sp.]|nr:nicotinic acid mononucleotide adenylyltransferase [Ktedonobacter sp.]